MNLYTLAFINGSIVTLFVGLIGILETSDEIALPVTLGCGLLAAAASIVIARYLLLLRFLKIANVYDALFAYVVGPIIISTWPILLFGMYSKVLIQYQKLISIFGLLVIVSVAFFLRVVLYRGRNNDGWEITYEHFLMINSPPRSRSDFIPTDLILLITYLLTVVIVI